MTQIEGFDGRPDTPDRRDALLLEAAERLVEAGILYRPGQPIKAPKDPTTFWQGFGVGLAIGLMVLLLSACSYPLYPSTAGSHAPSSKADQGARYIVWSNHPPVAHYLGGLLLGAGYPVVERTRLDAIFAEQKLRLSHAREEDVLRVGRLIGATHVIFAEVRGLEHRGPLDYPSAQSVAVRSVLIESGEVRWSGMASYPEPSDNPEQSVIVLAHWAMWRATCRGTWEEPTAQRKGGCHSARDTVVQVTPSTEPRIWKDMERMEHKR